MPYSSMLLHVNLDSLAAHREDLSQRLSRDIMDPASCLHSRIPPSGSNAITSKLRSSQFLPIKPVLIPSTIVLLYNIVLYHYQ